MIAALPVEGAAQHKVVATPLKVNGQRSTSLRPPPALGADTDAVLEAAGFARADIATLRQQGVI